LTENLFWVLWFPNKELLLGLNLGCAAHFNRTCKCDIGISYPVSMKAASYLVLLKRLECIQNAGMGKIFVGDV